MNRYFFISNEDLPKYFHEWRVDVFIGEGRGSGKSFFLKNKCRELTGFNRRVGVLLGSGGASLRRMYEGMGAMAVATIPNNLDNPNNIFCGMRLDDILVDDYPILYQSANDVDRFLSTLAFRMKSREGKIIIAHDREKNRTSIRKGESNFIITVDELPTPEGAKRIYKSKRGQ